METESIVVLDFGAQYSQLIARRIRELKIFSVVLPFNASLEEIRSYSPVGIILSGGPSSVYDKDAPKCDPAVLGNSTERKIYTDGAAQFAAAVQFTDQQQLRDLLEAIEEKDRLIALLSGCIEAPEPVHVELGLDKICPAH